MALSPQVKDALEVVLYKPIWIAAGGALLSWLVGYLGFSFVWLWIVVFGCLMGEKIMMRRLVDKEVVRRETLRTTPLEPAKESVEWINMLTQKVYQNYGRFIAQTIIDKVTPIMKEKKPGAISDIGFTKVDLGKQIPRMSNFIVHNTEPGIIMMDMDIEYLSDFEIEIYATTGVSVPLRIEDLTFKAKFRFTIETKPNAEPFVRTIKVQILDRPTVDISVKPLVGIDVMGVPVASNWIKSMIEDQMVEALHYPKFIEVKIDDSGDIQAEVKEEEEAKEGLLGSAAAMPGRAIGAGFDMTKNAVTGVGNLGVGAVKGVGSVGTKGLQTCGSVGNVGVDAVKGVGNLGTGAVKGVGNIGSGAMRGVGGGFKKMGSFSPSMSMGMSKSQSLEEEERGEGEEKAEKPHKDEKESVGLMHIPSLSLGKKDKSPRPDNDNSKKDEERKKEKDKGIFGSPFGKSEKKEKTKEKGEEEGHHHKKKHSKEGKDKKKKIKRERSETVDEE